MSFTYVGISHIVPQSLEKLSQQADADLVSQKSHNFQPKPDSSSIYLSETSIAVKRNGPSDMSLATLQTPDHVAFHTPFHFVGLFSGSVFFLYPLNPFVLQKIYVVYPAAF